MAKANSLKPSVYNNIISPNSVNWWAQNIDRYLYLSTPTISTPQTSTQVVNLNIIFYTLLAWQNNNEGI